MKLTLKCRKLKLEEVLTGLFIISIPMNPIFTLNGFYLLGILQVLLFLFYCSKQKRFRFTTFEILYFCFIVFNIISLLWSPTGQMRIIMYIIIYFAFTVASIRNLDFIYKGKIDRIIQFYGSCFLLGTILISIICIIYEYPLYNGAVRLGTYLFAEPYGTRMMYTYNLEISIFYVMFMILANKNRFRNIVLLVFLTLCVLLSGTRKILVGMLVFYLAFIWFENRKQFLKIIKWLILLMIGALIIYYFMMNNETLYMVFGKRIDEYLTYLLTGEGDASATERDLMISYALQLFRENPIAGIGSDGFHYMFNLYAGRDLYSHNTFTELLCNLGIIGFFLYYGFYFRNIIGTYKKRKNFYFTGLLFSGMLALLVMDYWTITYCRIHFMLFFEVTSLYCIYAKDN